MDVLILDDTYQRDVLQEALEEYLQNGPVGEWTEAAKKLLARLTGTEENENNTN